MLSGQTYNIISANAITITHRILVFHLEIVMHSASDMR